MKKMARLLAVIMTAVILTVSVSAASAVLKDQDTTTHGDWVGKYGSEGYILFRNSEAEDNNHLPSYVTLEYVTIFGEAVSRAVWYDESAGGTPTDNSVNSLYTDDTQTTRTAACIYNTNGMNITIDVGSTPKLVSLYCLDYDFNARGMSLSIMDESGNELCTQDVVEFDGGKYITAEVTGKVTFEFILFEGTNTVVSGIFFDPVAGAEPVKAEPEQVTAEEVNAEEVVAETAIAPVSDAPEATTAQVSPETSDITVYIVLTSVFAAAGAYIALKSRKYAK